MNIHIILFGSDCMLNLTRSLLLKHIGFAVSIASTVSELKRIVTLRPVQLIVVCYTAEAPDYDAIFAFAQSFEPRVKIALLSSIVEGSTSLRPGDWDFTIERPEEFIRTIRRLLYPSRMNPVIPAGETEQKIV